MSVASLASLTALLSYGGLMYILARRGLRGMGGAVQLFFLNLLLMTLWQASALLVSLTHDVATAIFGYNIMLIVTTGHFLVYFAFVRAFLHIKGQQNIILSGILAWATFTMSSIWYRSKFIAGMYWAEATGFFVPVLGPGIYLAGLFEATFLGYAIFLLLQRVRKARSTLERNRILYLLLGSLMVMLGTFSNLIPSLKPYPVDIIANIINALLIAYAILRYQLLDITVVVRKGLLYSIPTAIIGAGYFLLISLTMRLFHAFASFQIFLLSLIVAIITAMVAQPLRDRAQSWIDRLFFREKYDSRLMLQRVSQTATSVLELRQLTSMLLDEVTNMMHISKAGILLKEETGEFRLVAQRGLAPVLGLRLRGDHPVVRWLASEEGLLTRDDVDTMPQFKALWGREKEDLERLGAGLFVPLRAKGELVGIFALGPKLSEETYSADDQITLTTLANHTAVALENARLFSDLKQSLQELKQTRAQLIQADKLSALGRMIAGVAHEINNPLPTIMGYAQLLQGEEVSDQVRRDLERISEAAKRSQRTVQNLLAFARASKPQRDYLDINQVIEETLALRSYQLKVDNIEVVKRLEGNLPWTMADRYQLQQVFLNLINNAQQAMAEQGGGRLAVRSELRTGDTIRVTVSDTGPGIPEEIMPRLFEPFFTTKEVGKGTGLGLSVSYGIVSEHRGRIWAESEEGKGANFIVELPVQREAKPVAEPIVEVEKEGGPEGKLVLIIDDEKDIVALLARVLREEGHRVSAALDGQEALKRVAEEDYDLIISDVKMPTLDGRKLYKHLKETNPELVEDIVFITGDTASADTKAFLEEIGNPRLEKPFDIEKLRGAIREALKG